MRHLLLAAMLVGAMSAHAGTLSFTDSDPTFGTPPPKSEHWINFALYGGRNHPLPSVYFYSGKSGSAKRWGFERWIHLTPQEFPHFDDFTHAQLRAYQCLGAKDALKQVSGPSEGHVLMVSEHAHRQTRILCMLSSSDSCRYLAEVLKFPGINWTVAKTDGIIWMREELNCTASP
jgi:hypothetical protein